MNRKLVLTACALLAAVLAGAGAVAVPRLLAPTQVGVCIGGPFQLTDGDGRSVSEASFRGKWMLVYFGYTHCPDACPTALQDIADTLDLLPPAGRAEVVPLFITVDPARDTPAVMKDYAAAFGPAIVPLSGSQDAITRVERQYRVYAAKHPTQDGDYEMDHSSVIYLMDPQGRFVANFTHESSPKDMADKLRQLGA